MNNKGRKIAILLTAVGGILLVWLVKSLFLESYRIASGQMENTLLEGDRLWVNKCAYGIRLPQAWLALPFLHDSIPGTRLRSYDTATSLPYRRLGERSPRHNDVVAFNVPQPSSDNIPIDRLPIAIARCIALPGDTVVSRDGMLFINGIPVEQPDTRLESYLSASPEIENILQTVGIENRSVALQPGIRLHFLEHGEHTRLQSILPGDTLLQPVRLSRDEYTIVLPRPHEKYAVTPENAAWICDLLNRYEGTYALCRNGRIYLEGREIFHYTPSQPYYWVICDNRSAHSDSRTFGVLPHTHLIGKAVGIGISIDPGKRFPKSIRFSRLFQSDGL